MPASLARVRAPSRALARVRAPSSPSRSARGRHRRATTPRAIPQYGDPVFDAVTREAFDAGDAFVADAEEARVLWDCGWDFLDVRDDAEAAFFGSIPNPPPGTIGGHNEVVVVSGREKVRRVPLVRAKGYRYASSVNAKVFVDPAVDDDFVAEVEKEFPDKKKASIVVVCSDGRQRAVAALARARPWSSSGGDRGKSTFARTQHTHENKHERASPRSPRRTELRAWRCVGYSMSIHEAPLWHRAFGESSGSGAWETTATIEPRPTGRSSSIAPPMTVGRRAATIFGGDHGS